MAKYGIKHTAGAVKALTIFKNNIIAPGFTEITQADYILFVNQIQANPFFMYDDTKNELASDAQELASVTALITKELLRDELLKLSNSLELEQRLGEDSTSTQAAFDAKKLEYEAT
ncbi:MAG: hypothetical protein ACPG6B_01455 [Oceanihabitans sp.]